MTDAKPASRGWILAALMAAMMLAAMDVTIVSTVIPQIVGDLGGFALFAWVFSIYVLAQTVMIPVYGKLADQYGRKPILIGGTLLFLLGSACCALSWNMTSLIVFRGLQGLGAGSIMATTNTLAADLYSLRERSRVQGWLSTVWGFSALVGPVLGGLFAEYLNWRWIFLINVPVGIAAITLLSVFLHEKVEKHPHKIDYAGAIFIMLTVGCLVFGLLQGGQSWPWWSWQSALLLLLFIVLGMITLRIERHAAEPIMPGWLWKRRVLVGSNLAMIGMGIVMMGPITYLPTFAQSVHGLGIIAAGFVLAVTSIGWPLASASSGPLSEHFGFRSTALAGVVVVFIAAGGFLLIPQNASSWWLLLDQFLFGVGYGLISTPLLVGPQSVVGWAQRGVVTGTNMFSRFLGQTLGAAIFGAIFNYALRQQLNQAPAALGDALPDGLNQVVGALNQPDLSRAVGDFLRQAIFNATGWLYAGIMVFAVVMFLVTLIAPHHFPVKDE